MDGVRNGGMPDLGAVLEEIRREVGPHFGKGRVASYIPALKRVPAGKFGMAVALEVLGRDEAASAAGTEQQQRPVARQLGAGRGEVTERSMNRSGDAQRRQLVRFADVNDCQAGLPVFREQRRAGR